MKSISLMVTGLVLIGLIIFGCTMIGKFLSYKLFYEAQVKATVYEVLRLQGLIGK